MAYHTHYIVYTIDYILAYIDIMKTSTMIKG